MCRLLVDLRRELRRDLLEATVRLLVGDALPGRALVVALGEVLVLLALLTAAQQAVEKTHELLPVSRNRLGRKPHSGAPAPGHAQAGPPLILVGRPEGSRPTSDAHLARCAGVPLLSDSRVLPEAARELLPQMRAAPARIQDLLAAGPTADDTVGQLRQAELDLAGFGFRSTA